MAPHRSRVSDSDAGRRLDAVVAELPGVGSRTAAERLVTAGDVLVDGQSRPKSFRLEGGEELDVTLPEAQELVAESIALDIVHEDEHLLVVDKPAGLVVHPSGGQQTGTLAHGLLALGAAVATPSDRASSIASIATRRGSSSSPARTRPMRACPRRSASARVDREYLALVRGTPRSRTGRITAPIGRDRRDRTRHSLDTDTPREAVTWFEVRELLGDRTLLDVRLETGRTHQIRVHLEAVELPVSGDPVYGVRGDLGLERQFLHAYRLAFEHPFTGAPIEVESALPADLDRALALARDVAGH